MPRGAARPAAPLRLVALLGLAASCAGTGADGPRGSGSQADRISNEVVVHLGSGGHVGLSTRGPSAFRVRLIAGEPGSTPPVDTPMVQPDRGDAPFKYFKGKGEGIVAGFGGITVSSKGTLVLWSGTVGGQVLAETEELQVPSNSLTFQGAQESWGIEAPFSAKVYGGGASPMDASGLRRNGSQAAVCNRATYAPQYYHSNGYAALGVVDSTSGYQLPLSWQVDGEKVRWSFNGSLELFLIPAKTLMKGTMGLYELIGAPLVPPRYALGFFASRWGWKDKAYTEQVVSKFREERYPLDSVIFDFEWFANETDYAFSPAGRSWYHDFGYNPRHFPSPKADLRSYHQARNLRVGGIRKPRLGNSALLKLVAKKGWLLPGAENGGTYPPIVEDSYAHKRNLDFSRREVRDWYAEKLAPLVKDGFDFWWNDEGEVDYFLFHWWNVAEIQALRKVSESRRFFSLNRAFSPGMARLGAAVWTGDIHATWEDMRSTAGTMLNWVLSGMPHVGCDIGGFDGEPSTKLLVRWMQMGAFLPIMRVHSATWTPPHWPWRKGEKAAKLLRKALEMRYHLLPYHYSMAHAMYEKKALWVRPLAMDLPDDDAAVATTLQWMDGDILVAPIMNEESKRDIYLPKGTWYKLWTHSVIEGPTTIGGVAELDEVPAFVRAGTIVTMAGVLEHTDALPGGPLEVQVYAGADCKFRLVEDDGETNAYQEGRVRATTFEWHEASSTLTWTVEGLEGDINGSILPNAFVDVAVVVHDHLSEEGTLRLPVQALGAYGSASAVKWRRKQRAAQQPVTAVRRALTQRRPYEPQEFDDGPSGNAEDDAGGFSGTWRAVAVCGALGAAIGLATTAASDHLGRSRRVHPTGGHLLLVASEMPAD